MATGTAAKPVRVTEQSSRRSFHVRAISAMGALISGTLGVPAVAYLLGPKARKSEEWVELGDASALVAGQPIQMAGRRNRIDGWKVISEKITAWVVKQPSGNVVAFGPQCTHLGCAHHWDQSGARFVCPCHNSVFSIEGAVLSGPAPRPLDRYDVRLENNKLLLGSLRRSSERAV